MAMANSGKSYDLSKSKQSVARADKSVPADGYDSPSESCEHETIADEQRRRSDSAPAASVAPVNPSVPVHKSV
jgi:hypothetical protein